jgi:H+/Cl- antiporter ClcA
MLEINFQEILIYMLFGIILGLIGALFVTCLKNVVLFKRYLFRMKVVNNYTYSIPILALHILFYYFYSPFGIQDESLRIVFLETSYE